MNCVEWLELDTKVQDQGRMKQGCGTGMKRFKEKTPQEPLEGHFALAVTVASEVARWEDCRDAEFTLSCKLGTLRQKGLGQLVGADQ